MRSYEFNSNLTAKQIYATSLLPSSNRREMAFTLDPSLSSIVASMPSASAEILEDIEIQLELTRSTNSAGREFYTQILEAVVGPLLEKSLIVYLRIESIDDEEHPCSKDRYSIFTEGDTEPIITFNSDFILNKACVNGREILGLEQIKKRVEALLIVPPNASRIPRWSIARKLWYQRMLVTRLKRGYETKGKFLIRDFILGKSAKVKANKFDARIGTDILVLRHINYLTYVKGYDNLVCRFEEGNLVCYEQVSKLRIVTFILNDDLEVIDIEYIFYGFNYCKCSSNVFTEGQPYASTLKYLPHISQLKATDLTKLPSEYYLDAEVTNRR